MIDKVMSKNQPFLLRLAENQHLNKHQSKTDKDYSASVDNAL